MLWVVSNFLYGFKIQGRQNHISVNFQRQIHRYFKIQITGV